LNALDPAEIDAVKSSQLFLSVRQEGRYHAIIR
jgi:hypothetical protein